MRILAKTALAAVFALGVHLGDASARDGSYGSCPNCQRDGSFSDSLGLGLRSRTGLNISGWIDAGFIGNTSSPASKFNGPYNAVDRSNEAMMNQLYLIAEKELPRCGYGIGGRIDYLYGEDYFLAESIGIEKRTDGTAHWNKEYYGSAFPQAYVSLGNQELSLQLGHFYSVVGYEGVMSPDNFFYSKSYSYQFARPFTHWGGQLNWNPGKPWSFQLGLHNGWDAFDRVSDKLGFIGKVRYDAKSGAWTSFAITTGDEFNDAAGVALTQDYSNRTQYSLLVGLPLTCKLDYVFHYWNGSQDNGAANGSRADWYGIDSYLTYTVNDRLKLGTRTEWFRDDDGTRVGLNRPSNPNIPSFNGDFYSLSFGMNWTPTSSLVFRPELRANWFDGFNPTKPFDDGNKNHQFMLGCDVILRI